MKKETKTTKTLETPVEETKTVKTKTTKAGKKAEKMLKITLIKSTIGCLEKQKRTITAGYGRFFCHRQLGDGTVYCVCGLYEEPGVWHSGEDGLLYLPV